MPNGVITMAQRSDGGDTARAVSAVAIDVDTTEIDMESIEEGKVQDEAMTGTSTTTMTTLRSISTLELVQEYVNKILGKEVYDANVIESHDETSIRRATRQIKMLTLVLVVLVFTLIFLCIKFFGPW